MSAESVKSGVAAVDGYLDTGYATVVGMSSRFAAAVACGLMRIQTDLGVTGPVAEIGTFEGRFFIALAHALADGEKALGIDLFDWPNPEVIDRFEANCAKHGVPAEQAHHVARRQPHDGARRICWRSSTGSACACFTSTASTRATR